MIRSRRIPLNPCDYLYYAHHRMLQRKTGAGSLAYMIVETEGHVSPDRVRDSLAAAMAAHPVMIAPLRVSRLSGRPYWQVPSFSDALVHQAAEQAFVCDDLRPGEQQGPPDAGPVRWESRLERLCSRRYVPRWELRAGARLRLEQYILPGGRTRFRLLWPHFLMDAEGAQWFLREIDRLCEGAVQSTSPPTCAPHEAARNHRHEACPTLLPDEATVDVLAGRSFLERYRLLRRGFALQAAQKGLRTSSLASNPSAAVDSLGLIHRHWATSDLKVLHAAARQATLPGPALYARHLAACVIRALHRLYVEQGVESGGYLITFPMRPASGCNLDSRPVPGNYLVSPTICVRREQVHDHGALAEAVQRQLDDYRRDQGDSAQWAMVWAASFLRASFYDLIFKLPLGFERLSSGFSYYGEIKLPLRSFCGATVINFFGGGPLGTPPGWNPVFSRWRDRLNLSLTWNRPHIADWLAARYATLIEDEMFTGG